MTGDLAVVVVPPDVYKSAGCDIQLWLNGLAADDLESCHTFLLRKNGSVWIPFGFVPLVVGLAEVRKAAVGDKKKQSAVVWPDFRNKQIGDYRGYLVIPAFGLKLDSEKDKASAKKLSALLDSSHDHMPNSLKTHPVLKQFAAKVQALNPKS